MEDPAPSFSSQLSNLAELQARIEQTRKELGHLTRVEAHEGKQLQSVLSQSMLMTRNRLNLWENHVKSNERSEKR